MTDPTLPQKFQQLQQQVSAGDWAAARASLAQLQGTGDAQETLVLELFEVELSVMQREVEPGMGLNRIVGIMRRSPTLPYAKDLYQRVSKLAYSGGKSSLSHSHPPPPPDPESE
ncbi:MAG TPA: hypothetical protein VL137_00805 [Polyangiaceae bacterium]|nr:hypothetical protein [Polyangiaceae bacterium]